MMRDPRVLLVLAGLLALGSGCGAGDQAGMEKRMRALEEEVTRLQNDNDRLAERVAGMETAPAAAAPGAADAPGGPVATPAAAAEGRPLLQVVRLEPGSSGSVAGAGAPAAGEAADDEGAPRPVIRVEGSRTRRSFEGVRPAQPESP